MNIAIRACRFGIHLGLHYPGLLLREIRSAIVSALSWPFFLLLSGRIEQRIKVDTERPIAVDSPDHLHPHGTAFNHATHFGFMLWAAGHFTAESSMLDLGCSSGRLVRDFRRIGWIAVGLEGSDYSLKWSRPCWDMEAGASLFTCDIGRPWSITNNCRPLTFDLITAFHVLEHLDRDGLVTLCAQITRHSRCLTQLVISTANRPEIQDGVELHRTRWDRQQWLRFFAEYLPDFELTMPVPDCLMLRRSVDDLDFVLKRMTGNNP